MPQVQPNPTDLTNALLLRILQQNTSFGGTDPLAPVSDISPDAVISQNLLFASLSLTLLVAFIAVLGKQWVRYYTRATTWGNIVDRGKEHQIKLVGLRKWGFHLAMGSLPIMLQFSLFLFCFGVVSLFGRGLSPATFALGFVTSAFIILYGISVRGLRIKGFPFHTPLSLLILKVLRLRSEFTTPTYVRLKHWLR